MSGLSRVAGIGPRVTLNGKDYQVRGKTNRFFAEVQAQILKLRGDPFKMIVEAGIAAKLNNDPDLLDRVAGTVSENFRNWGFVTYQDYLEFLRTPEGDAYTAYHCLTHDAPEITLDDVRDYLINMKFKSRLKGDEEAKKEIEELDNAILDASGEGRSGNSNGQTPKLATVGT